MRKTGLDLGSWVIAGLTLGGLAASSGLPVGEARAAAGDPLVVTGDGVNVRFEPRADARVKMRVYHDQEVTELQREPCRPAVAVEPSNLARKPRPCGTCAAPLSPSVGDGSESSW